MRQETYDKKSQDPKYWSAAGFLQTLHRNGVPVQDLMTNDWQNVPSPKVYVLEREYKRFSDYDFTNALNYWKKKKEGEK
jgi:hypothetical protein